MDILLCASICILLSCFMVYMFNLKNNNNNNNENIEILLL